MQTRTVVNSSPQNWTNNHYYDLLRYRGQWICFNPEQGVLASHESYIALSDLVEQQFPDAEKIFMFVKKEWEKAICLPIYFKTVDIHPWKPLYNIELSLDNQVFNAQRMLVDSGADMSVISNEYGIKLGLELAKNEKIFSAIGIGGGSLSYVEREIYLRVDNKHTLLIPVAWIQDVRYNEMIIGREVVFDAFDIEFKQADEQIIFKKREAKPAV
jgi:hypothetical protein